MKTEHLADVHPIDVVTSKNTDMLRIGIFDEVHVLVNGIRGAFIPTFPIRICAGIGSMKCPRSPDILQPSGDVASVNEI